MIDELITVGLSEEANKKLDYLRDEQIFAEKADGYRFAIGLALAHGVIPPEISNRATFLNVGSLDPDQMIKNSVEALMPKELDKTTVYRLVERLADWGVNELYASAQKGDIDFAAIFDQVAKKAS